MTGLFGPPLAALPPVVHASYAMYILAVLFLLPALLFIFLAKRGREFYIRRIPGIDAIEEAIGRATELGRPMMFSTGLTGLNALLYALLGIVTYVSKKAATYGCRLIFPQCDYQVMPIVEETAREAYRAVGRVDQFNPQDVRFLSPSQFAFASGYMGIAHREQAASCFLFGSFAAESLILAEAGQQVGAMQVAGTPTLTQVPFFLTSCDYTIIGEEVYAAGAYLSREPSQLGSIRGQDVSKLVVLAMLMVGLGFATVMSIARRDTLEGQELNNPFARILYAQPGQKRVLARIEARDSYAPKPAPKHEDLEKVLAVARKELAYTAKLVRGEMRVRIAERLAAEEKALRAALPHFKAGPGRTEAEAVAERLKLIKERAEKETGLRLAEKATDKEPAKKEKVWGLKELLKERLPEMGEASRAKARQRAAELYKPEVERLAYWVSQQSDAGVKKRCGGLVRAAEALLADGKSTSPRIRRAVERAREACYDAHFAAAKADFSRAERAAEEKTPRFLLRTKLRTKKVLDSAVKDEVKAKEKEIDAAVKKLMDTIAEWLGPALAAEFHKEVEDVARKLEEDKIRKRLAGKIEKPTPLILDGTESVSGRGRPLPLSHKWEVVSLPGMTTVATPGKAQSKVIIPSPGGYILRLAVDEKLTAAKSDRLGIDGEVPSKVEHKKITVGSEQKLSWRPAKDAVLGSCKVHCETKGLGPRQDFMKVENRVVDAESKQWDPDRKRDPKEKDGHPVKLVFEEPGLYRTTIIVRYRRKPVADKAAEKKRQEAAAAAGADEKVKAARKRLALELSDVLDSLNRVNRRLGGMEKLAEKYKEQLGEFEKKKGRRPPSPVLVRRRKELTDENWPDRKAAIELYRYVKDLREWVTASTKYAARLRAQAGILGTGKLDLPAAKDKKKEEKKPEPPRGGQKPDGPKRPAGPKLKGTPEKYVAGDEKLSYRLAAEGGEGPYKYKVEGLPEGLSFDGTDTVSGTLKAPGPHSGAVTITDSKGAVARATLTLGISRPGWKRYRINWTVLDPKADSKSLEVLVEEAPRRLRPPWKPIPEKKDADKKKAGGEDGK